MDENIRKLKELIDGSDNIVFFGGAGVSTESGIPDFRSVDGLYNQTFRYPPETILSHTFYEKHTEEFYQFYRAKMLCTNAALPESSPASTSAACARLRHKSAKYARRRAVRSASSYIIAQTQAAASGSVT